MILDMIIIVLGAMPLLYFLISTFPRLRKVGEPWQGAGAEGN